MGFEPTDAFGANRFRDGSLKPDSATPPFCLALFPFDVEVSLIAHQSQIRYGVMVEPNKVAPAMEISHFLKHCNKKWEQSLLFLHPL